MFVDPRVLIVIHVIHCWSALDTEVSNLVWRMCIDFLWFSRSIWFLPNNTLNMRFINLAFPSAKGYPYSKSCFPVAGFSVPFLRIALSLSCRVLQLDWIVFDPLTEASQLHCTKNKILHKPMHFTKFLVFICKLGSFANRFRLSSGPCRRAHPIHRCSRCRWRSSCCPSSASLKLRWRIHMSG